MLTALAVGCSKELPTVNENAWIYDESLPVPIQFGSLSSGMVTKAAVSNLGGLTGKPIGVFAWGEGSSDSMKASAESIFPAGFMRAQVAGDITGGVGSLKFWEKDAQASTKVYYPMSSKYDYSFYAYYTGEEPALGTYGVNDYSIDVDFSRPFTDILWGKCSDSDLQYNETTLPHLKYKENQIIKGFNSRFSRAAAKQVVVDKERYYPSIEFKHACSAFSFYAKADEDQSSMTSEKLAELNEHVKINSVEITNVSTSAKLIVAARNADDQGKFSGTESTSSVSMDIYDGYAIQQTSDGVVLSTAASGGEDQFFLPPGDYSNSQAILHCTLDDNPFELSFDLKYTNEESEDSTEFEAGKSYSFVVIFKTLEEIQAYVTLKDWVNGPKTDVDIEDL